MKTQGKSKCFIGAHNYIKRHLKNAIKNKQEDIKKQNNKTSQERGVYTKTEEVRVQFKALKSLQWKANRKVISLNLTGKNSN